MKQFSYQKHYSLCRFNYVCLSFSYVRLLFNCLLVIQLCPFVFQLCLLVVQLLYLIMPASRLRAVPLRSVTSKLGRTGESEFTRARKARVRSERKPRGSRVPLSVNSLSPVLPSLDVTDRRGTARSLACFTFNYLRYYLPITASSRLSCTRFENGVGENSRCERFRGKRRKLSTSINIVE